MNKLSLEKTIGVLDNKYISTGLSMFLALYAGFARPTLSKNVLKIFDNQLFRLAVLFLIAYKANRDPQLSIMIAVAFMVSLNVLAEKEMKESFQQIENFKQAEHYNNIEY